MRIIIECERERVLRGARTFMVKIKGHLGESLNEWADTKAQIKRRVMQEEEEGHSKSVRDKC